MEPRHKISVIVDLLQRISAFTDRRLDYIRPFYNSDEKGFSYSIDDSGNPESGGPYVTSTATCISMLKKWGELSNFSPNLSEIKDALLNAQWQSGDLGKNNPYTLGLVLPALFDLGVDKTEDKVQAGLRILRRKIGKGKGGISLFADAPDIKSAFVTWWVLYSLDLLDDSNDWHNNKKQQAIEWAEKQVYKQISYFNSEEVDSKNVYQLAFAWAICEKFGEPKILKRNVSNHVLKLIFDDQKPEGIWPLYYPLFHFPRVGSAYVYHFELLIAVLSNIDENPLVLEEYLENIVKIIEWVESRLMKHPSGVSGWSITTDPKRRDRPISWATIEVLQVLCYLDVYLRQILRELIFKLLAGSGTRSKEQDKRLDDVIDIDIPNETSSVKNVLKNRIIDPIRNNNKTLKGIDSEIALSIILFGPPGTSKTTLARAVAGELGWPLIELDPSIFAPREGIGFEMRIIEVFSYLEKLYDTVILLDELDELVRERTSGESDRVGRLWTTLMLPNLSRLRDEANSVVFVATNHIRVIDVSAIRPGRFDMVLPVGPPQSAGKLQELASRISVSPTDLNSWWNALESDRKTCFEHLLFGEMGILIRNMESPPTKEGFSKALGIINEEIYLHLKRKDNDILKSYFEKFEETCNDFTRLP